MKLYLAAGKYVGTQADAKRLDKSFAQVDVPTDKEGLIGYLNNSARPVFEDALDARRADPDDGSDLLAPAAPYQGPQVQPDSWESGADRVLSPPDADGIVQRIMGSTGYELKRYASAVAQAFNALGGK